MKKLDLTLSAEKSRLVNIWDDTDGFDFLGLHHRKFPVRKKGGFKIYVMSHIPSKKAMKKMREKIKEFVGKNNKLFLSMEDIVEGLNRRLQGFKNYYLISPIAKKWLSRIDWYVLERLTIFWNRKRNKRHKHARMGEVVKMTNYTLVKLAT
jgi:hypothetical protein